MTIPVTKHMHAGGHFSWPTQPGATRSAIMDLLAEKAPAWSLVALSPLPQGVTFREREGDRRLVRVSMPKHLMGPQSVGKHADRARAVVDLLMAEIE